MKKKLLLLATAAVFFSPVAAKANQKGSIYVGLTGALQQFVKSTGDQVAFDNQYKDETFYSFGLEAGYGYKVWNNLQVAGWVRGVYSFEHEYAKDKDRAKAPAVIEFEPRVTLGWEFPVNNCFSITPFIGAGVEMSFTKKDGKKYSTDWTIPAVAGVRANYGYFFASVNARYDLTTGKFADKKAGQTEENKARAWGAALTVGAEF
jgi:hypothetical protein